MKTFRKWLANKLASLARRIYPQSEEVMSFWSDRMMDMMITGKSIIRVQAVKPEEYEYVTYPTSTATDPETKKRQDAMLERSMRITKPRTLEEIAVEVLNRAFEKDEKDKKP